MTQNKTESGLWHDHRQEFLSGAVEKKGKYFEIRRALFEVLPKARQLSLLGKRTSVGTYERQFELYFQDSGYAVCEILVNFATNDLRIAIRPNRLMVEKVFRYYITPDGVAIDQTDVDNHDATSKTEEWNRLADCLRHVLTTLKREIETNVYRNDQRRRTRRRKIKKVSLFTGGSVLLIGLICTLVNVWGIQPAEAGKRARVAYDSGNHQLDSAGYPVDMHPLGNLSDGSVQQIPSYGGDDKTLTHPRTVKIRYSSSDKWCKKLTVDVPSGNQIVVAVEEGSPFHKDRYTATYTGRDLTVCLIDGFSAKYEAQEIEAHLALQVKSQGSTS